MTINLKAGDVVQIDPDYDEVFGGCFMVVTEPKSWGAMGYFSAPGEKGLAYYRCPHSAMELVGHAVWVNQRDIEVPNVD